MSVVVLGLGIVLISSQIVLADTIYVDVDAGGNNNGSSWEDAYTNLQDALALAQPGDQIWVAAGTYYPGSSREDYFAMRNGVAIYGGFNGTETELDERDPAEHETLLSGDLGTPGDDSDNCYHVFYHPFGSDLDSTAILNGFTITGGNANGESSHGRGGGMYNNSSTLQVINCIFSGNSATYGGGIANDSSPRFVNVIIANNTAEHSGAGMDNFGSSPILTNCTFINNTAANFGGGMSNDMASPTLINCTFYNNSAIAGVGGGLSNYTYSDARLINCTFFGNSSGADGGGMWSGGASPVVTNCIFWGNTPNEMYGGGIPLPIITYSNILGGYEGEGNIDADFLFVDPENGVLHLQDGSPSIDAGNPDPQYDDGCQPPGLGTERNDMGVYGGPENCAWDVVTSIERDDLSRVELITPLLSQNYPNPFNPTTTIVFTILKSEHVRLKIYSLLGETIERLVSEKLQAGTYSYTWNSTNLPSGLYMYRLDAGNFVETKKMVLVR
jgi:hypothetical protein